MESIAHRRAYPSTKDTVSGFTAIFGGILLFLAAVLGVLQGASAIANDQLYAAGTEYLYQFDMTTWGWIHVIVGLLCAAVAIGIVIGTGWGLVTGMIVAGLSTLTNFAFLPIYPVWSIILIGFNVLIIWALNAQMPRAQR